MDRAKVNVRPHLTYWDKYEMDDPAYGKTMGTRCVIHQQPIKAIDGLVAYPIIWISDINCKIQHRCGFTRPVDFTKDKKDNGNPYEGMPDVDASDDDWEEWTHERMKSDGSYEEIERKMMEMR